MIQVITRASTANRLIHNKNHEIRSNQSIVTEKIIRASLQSETQTASNLNLNINITGTTERMSNTEVTGISDPVTSSLIPGNTIPLEVPTKTFGSSSDIHKDPNTSDVFTTQNKYFAATCHQFQFQNTANLKFSQFNRTGKLYQCIIHLLITKTKLKKKQNCDKSTKWIK